jgi:hypothetical protein
MTKRLMWALVAVTALAVAASVAWAQGGWGFGRGCGARWQTMKPDDQQRVANLHQKIRQGQWDLYQLQRSGADQAKTTAKEKAIAGLRDQLHKVMVATRPATCPLGTQAGAPVTPPASPAAVCPWGNQPGAGCPWGGPGPGRGCGMGMGRGMGGRWGGACPWVQPSAQK